jgi:aminopeptidase 2
MEFWDGLWLNEGFATWFVIPAGEFGGLADMSRMAWYAVEAFYPEWNNWQSFVNEALQKALE